jgi:hypothetical protein
LARWAALLGGIRGPPTNFGCWAETKEKKERRRKIDLKFFKKDSSK